MSRTLSNDGLARLLASRSFQLEDLACLAGSTRRIIYDHITGRKDCPCLEQRIAQIFKLTPSQLRRKLRLPARQQKRAA